MKLITDNLLCQLTKKYQADIILKAYIHGKGMNLKTIYVAKHTIYHQFKICNINNEQKSEHKSYQKD